MDSNTTEARLIALLKESLPIIKAAAHRERSIEAARRTQALAQRIADAIAKAEG